VSLQAAGRASLLEFYFVKRIDNSRLRREIDPEKRRECFSLLGLGILVFLFGLLFAWQHFQCVRNGYQIEQLKAERGALEEWNHQLRLEQASLADPQRIDTLARKELGLVPPSAEQVIQVGGSGAAPPASEDSEWARNFSAPRAAFAGRGGGEAAPEP
jgi:cell division protein FtsL